MGEKRFKKIHASFERHEFLAVMLPSMLPPPTPFKLFVLSAGVAEMRFTHFLAAIFFGRFIRFTLESLLVIYFGPEIVGFFGSVVHRHARLTIAIVAAAALIGWWVWRLRKKSGKRMEISNNSHTNVAGPRRFDPNLETNRTFVFLRLTESRKLTIEFDREDDGRWIADISVLPASSRYTCIVRKGIGKVPGLSVP